MLQRESATPFILYSFVILPSICWREFQRLHILKNQCAAKILYFGTSCVWICFKLQLTYTSLHQLTSTHIYVIIWTSSKLCALNGASLDACIFTQAFMLTGTSSFIYIYVNYYFISSQCGGTQLSLHFMQQNTYICILYHKHLV